MLENSFSKDDLNKVIEFLNFIATRATFENWKTEDTIKHFRLLQHMQATIIPKIEAHLFEIERVIQMTPPPADPETESVTP